MVRNIPSVGSGAILVDGLPDATDEEKMKALKYLTKRDALDIAQILELSHDND